MGKHFKVFAPNPKGVVEGEWNGRPETEKGIEVERAYTPTSSDSNVGYMDLVVKVRMPRHRHVTATLPTRH